MAFHRGHHGLVKGEAAVRERRDARGGLKPVALRTRARERSNQAAGTSALRRSAPRGRPVAAAGTAERPPAAIPTAAPLTPATKARRVSVPSVGVCMRVAALHIELFAAGRAIGSLAAAARRVPTWASLCAYERGRRRLGPGLGVGGHEPLELLAALRPRILACTGGDHPAITPDRPERLARPAPEVEARPWCSAIRPCSKRNDASIVVVHPPPGAGKGVIGPPVRGAAVALSPDSPSG